jgi:hypothetical protein
MGKYIIYLIFSLSIFLFSCIHSKNQGNEIQHTTKVVNECPQNSDTLYDRMVILKALADSLNVSMPDFYLQSSEDFFKASEGISLGFFVWDLVDTSNNRRYHLNHCIEFYDKHVYHFAHGGYKFSFSHIAYIENGNITVFRAVNCKNRGHEISEVIKFLEEKYKDNPQRDIILNNVRNYRHFGYFLRGYTEELGCGEVDIDGL